MRRTPAEGGDGYAPARGQHTCLVQPVPAGTVPGMTDETSGTLITLGLGDVLALVESLPAWQDGLDDDPVWLRPVEAVGLTVDTEPLTVSRASLASIAAGTWPARPVAVDLVTATGQARVRLDAVAHYLRRPGVLFDPDGWYGQHLPVLFQRPDGTHRVLDGTHRVAAARIRHDSFVPAYVLTAADLAAPSAAGSNACSSTR
jgi:hypothetical protein